MVYWVMNELIWLLVGGLVGFFIGWATFYPSQSQSKAIKKKSQPGKEESETIRGIISRIQKLENNADKNRDQTE